MHDDNIVTITTKDAIVAVTIADNIVPAFTADPVIIAATGQEIGFAAPFDCIVAVATKNDIKNPIRSNQDIVAISCKPVNSRPLARSQNLKRPDDIQKADINRVKDILFDHDHETILRYNWLQATLYLCKTSHNFPLNTPPNLMGPYDSTGAMNHRNRQISL